MAISNIGGNESESSFFYYYLIGLLLGTIIRIAVFLAPIRVVRRLEETLLPDGTATDDYSR
jgi:hypothetical protein